MTFKDPANWCDRRCTRCPLIEICEEGLQVRRRRWAIETRGEDPDDPQLRLAERERIAENEPAAPASKDREPINLFVRRLEELAVRYTDGVSELLNQLPDEALAHDKAVLHIIDNAILIGGKVGRLSASLGTDGEPTNREFWNLDAVPNLLLLEALQTETEELLEPIYEDCDGESYERARDQLFEQLERYYQRLPIEARATLAEMCAEDLAPSPFVTIEPDDVDHD